MRILIPTLGFGRAGGHRVLSELANAWVRRGHDVVFLSPDSSEDPYFPTSATIKWVGGAGLVSNERRIKATPSARYHLWTLFRGLRAIGPQFHVVLANHSLTAWAVALAPCGNAGKFYYVQAYEPEYYASRGTFRGYLLALMSAMSYHFRMERIVNSPIYFRYGNLRASKFVAPGIDLSVFTPARNVKTIATSGPIVIGCIGRREPEKGTYYALRAFEQLYAEDKRFRLRIAYGNLPEGWVHKECEIVVPKNDRELADYYRSVDILVAAGTIQHGAPHYPVLEGLACGVPIVTTGYIGATKDTAWIVNNRNIDSICEAIREIVADPELRLKRRNDGLIATRRYSWDKVADHMLSIFGASSVTPEVRSNSV